MSVMILRSTKGRKRNRLQLGLGTEPSLKLTELELIKRTEKKKKRRESRQRWQATHSHFSCPRLLGPYCKLTSPAYPQSASIVDSAISFLGLPWDLTSLSPSDCAAGLGSYARLV